MRHLTIAVDDECAGLLERLANDRSQSLEDYIGSAINPELVAFLHQKARHWMPRSRWEELKRGEACSLCEHLSRDLEQSAEGLKICDLRVSRLWLKPNQSAPGYCVLTCLEHVTEPYELEKEKQVQFFGDLMSAGSAIARVMKPDKMNFEILGNGMPHLHCHIKPRFYGDAFAGIPFNENARKVFLEPEAYSERVHAIRRALLECS